MKKRVTHSRKRVGMQRLCQVVVGAVATLLGTATMAQSASTLARADGSAIVYYVQPAAQQPAQQLLVVMQGSDCNSVVRNARIQELFVPMLPDADVLTVEKYGIDASLSWDVDPERPDCPTAMIKHDSLSQRVQDYRAVLDAVTQQHRYKNVVVVGGSEGAVIAIMLAAQADVVDAAIAFNGGGRWFKDDVLHSIHTAPLAASEKAEALAGINGFLEYIQTSPDPNTEASGHGVVWWQEMLAHDQQAALLQVRVPLLVLQSGLDSSVDPATVTQMMQHAQQADRENIRYRTYPELDHVLQDAQGNSQLEKVINDMKAWLVEVTPVQP